MLGGWQIDGNASGSCPGVDPGCSL